MPFDDSYIRRHAYVSSRQKQRRRQRRVRIILFILILVLLLTFAGIGILIYKIKKNDPEDTITMDSLLEYVHSEDNSESDHEP